MAQGNPYSISSALKLIRNPERVNEVYHVVCEDLIRTAENINKWWYEFRYAGDSTDYITKDWDSLFILDACRLEYTEKYCDFEIAKAVSPATASRSFMNKMYSDRDMSSIVYLTANPFIERIETNFHDIKKAYMDHWDAEIGTVPPDVMSELTLKTHQEYPNKRIITHYMQPHYPFLQDKNDTFSKCKVEYDNTNESVESGRIPWDDQMYKREQFHDELLHQYELNHKIIFDIVQETISDISGKLVITSDHGNLIGERGFPIPIRLYGHPDEFYHENLIKVPWIEICNGRRNIEQGVSSESSVENDVSDRLSQLGYKP